MGRSTTIRLVGFGLAALSLGLVACAAGDDGEGSGNNNNNNGTGGLVSGDTGGGPGVPGATGGAPGATGGAPGATGGVPGAGGTGDVTIECTGAGFTFANGYVDTGTLCGYGWTATFGQGETIDPPCGSGTCFEAATEFCASAEVPQGEEWVSAAEPGVHTGVVLGFNVAEHKTEKPASTFPTTGSGLTVNYTFTASGGTESGTRVVVESGGKEYCADAASGTAIPWSSFQNECWEGGANTPLPAGAAISKVSVQILGSYEAPLTISNFCITGATVQ